LAAISPEVSARQPAKTGWWFSTNFGHYRQLWYPYKFSRFSD
jgi:hypothetical protein